MRQMIEALFSEYARGFVFLHILSAMVWVGGMIALRFVVHPAMMHIEDAKVRLARSLEIKQRFFRLVIPFIGLLALSSVFMTIGLNFSAGDPTIYLFTHVKEAIWTFMTVNFIYIYQKRNAAEKLFISGDAISTREHLKIIDDYLIPFNIFLGFVALLFGIILRGI